MSTWAGDLIRLARQEKGLSQRELARRASTSQAAIAAYEGGRRSPSLDTLARIIRAAGSDLRIRLEAFEDHDDWIRHYEANLPAQVIAAWRKRDRELIDVAQREQRPPTQKSTEARQSKDPAK